MAALPVVALLATTAVSAGVAASQAHQQRAQAHRARESARAEAGRQATLLQQQAEKERQLGERGAAQAARRLERFAGVGARGRQGTILTSPLGAVSSGQALGAGGRTALGA